MVWRVRLVDALWEQPVIADGLEGLANMSIKGVLPLMETNRNLSTKKWLDLRWRKLRTARQYPGDAAAEAVS